jgi:hypothetical protein
MLGHRLNRNLPDFQISIIYKSVRDWPEFIDAQYRKYGWSTRLARDRTIKTIEELPQLIWYESGELIGIEFSYAGSTRDFLKHCQGAYDVLDEVGLDLLHGIAEENARTLVSIN